MDVTQALKNAENSLRDFIALILSDVLGESWENTCGVSNERLEKWRERKNIEARKRASGPVDERLIYYADFYDLKTILKKQWHHFSDAFGDLKTFEVWLNELEMLRNPDAHRRELLPHQISLAIGISGEIRSKIASYRSSLETSAAYYPQIEFSADNLGNSWKPGQGTWVATKNILRPGDILEHVVTASDPLEESILYQFTYSQGSPRTSDQWGNKSSSSYEITLSDVGRMFFVNIEIKSSRDFHAYTAYDFNIYFTYEVLPPKM